MSNESVVPTVNTFMLLITAILKQFFGTIIVLTCSFIATAQYTNADTLHWRPDYKLKWEDFQGIPDSNIIAGAATYASFSCNSYYNPDSTIRFVINSVFF